MENNCYCENDKIYFINFEKTASEAVKLKKKKKCKSEEIAKKSLEMTMQQGKSLSLKKI